MAERKKRKRGPNLSVGRGEKLPASKGAGLTAKGRAKYNRETGSNLKPPVTGKPKPGESEEMKKKRAAFKKRHAKNIAKGKTSAAYWANRVKW